MTRAAAVTDVPIGEGTTPGLAAGALNLSVIGQVNGVDTFFIAENASPWQTTISATTIQLTLDVAQMGLRDAEFHSKLRLRRLLRSTDSLDQYPQHDPSANQALDERPRIDVAPSPMGPVSPPLSTHVCFKVVGASERAQVGRERLDFVIVDERWNALRAQRSEKALVLPADVLQCLGTVVMEVRRRLR
jgi:hypothetical protein